MNSQNSGGKFENDRNVTVEDNDCDDETKLNANTEPQVGEKLNDLQTLIVPIKKFRNKIDFIAKISWNLFIDFYTHDIFHHNGID